MRSLRECFSQSALFSRRYFLQSSVAVGASAIFAGVAAERIAAPSAPVTLVPPKRARGSTVIDVRSKGALGDGRHDDTAAIQSAIDSLPSGGGTVYVPAGTYLIDAVTSVLLRSRMHLLLAPGARLVAKPNGERRAYVLYAVKVSDVEISGGEILGDRASHLVTTGEWGHGIQIRGASRVTVRNIRISECWGDGVCIGGADVRQATPSDDIVISGIISTGNRRQGLSIGRSRNVRVHDSEFSNTYGTNPQYGIDIEPDRPGGTTGVHIENCLIKGNRGGGIQIYRRVSDVTIKGCTIEHNRGHGILAITAQDGLIVGNLVRHNGLVGVALRQQSSDFEVRDNRFAGNGTRRRRDAKARSNAASQSSFAVRAGEDTKGIRIGTNQYETR